MKKMSATKFNEHCLKFIRLVQSTGEPILVTKRGKPHVKIFSIESDGQSMGGKSGIAGDIQNPVVSPEEWKPIRQTKNIRRVLPKRPTRKH